MLSANFVYGQLSRQLLFLLYGSGLFLHRLKLAGSYLPAGCVIKILVCSVRTQERPWDVFCVLAKFLHRQSRINWSSIFGRGFDSRVVFL